MIRYTIERIKIQCGVTFTSKAHSRTSFNAAAESNKLRHTVSEALVVWLSWLGRRATGAAPAEVRAM